jgi:hypothetical protein
MRRWRGKGGRRRRWRGERGRGGRRRGGGRLGCLREGTRLLGTPPTLVSLALPSRYGSPGTLPLPLSGLPLGLHSGLPSGLHPGLPSGLPSSLPSGLPSGLPLGLTTGPLSFLLSLLLAPLPSGLLNLPSGLPGLLSDPLVILIALPAIWTFPSP